MTRLSGGKSFLVAAVLGLGVCASSVTSAQTNDQGSAQAQDQFQRDKVTLKDEAQRSVDAANANIDALKNKSKSENGQVKKQHDDLVNSLTMLRNHVNDDMSKMDKASINDWNGLRPVVQRDVSALNDQLKNASTITHVPLPAQTNP